jgi:glutamate formiminotransferase/glutamate formiminotransferase/formiminotetrahydrofolate cyclodeaminase
MAAQTTAQPLEAVPNLAEGRDTDTIDAIGRALRSHGVELLDVHSDADHQRSVFTVIGAPQLLAGALLAAAAEGIARIDLRDYSGVHPCTGALDVLPIVYLSAGQRELARDEALAVANRLGAEAGLPVFLYGELASGPDRGERAFFRDGGTAALSARLEAGELAPDFGPARLHPTAGATLVTARPPLVAFNIELSGVGVSQAREIAAAVREAGGGLPGVRAIGLELTGQQTVQVSANIHDPFEVPLQRLVEAVRREGEPRGAAVSAAELVGLAPAAALDGLELDLLRDFDPRLHVLEERIPNDGQIKTEIT